MSARVLLADSTPELRDAIRRSAFPVAIWKSRRIEERSRVRTGTW